MMPNSSKYPAMWVLNSQLSFQKTPPKLECFADIKYKTLRQHWQLITQLVRQGMQQTRQ